MTLMRIYNTRGRLMAYRLIPECSTHAQRLAILRNFGYGHYELDNRLHVLKGADESGRYNWYKNVFPL